MRNRPVQYHQKHQMEHGACIVQANVRNSSHDSTIFCMCTGTIAGHHIVEAISCV